MPFLENVAQGLDFEGLAEKVTRQLTEGTVDRDCFRVSRDSKGREEGRGR